jgi:hypothetical protein
MKKVVLILVCASILILGLSLPAGSVPQQPRETMVKRALVVILPANCTDQVKQKVSNQVEEIQVNVACECEETSDMIMRDHDFAPVRNPAGFALSVQVPIDYAFTVNPQKDTGKILIMVQRIED